MSEKTTLERVVVRPLALGIVALVPGVVAVVLVGLLNPHLKAGDLATVVAVPLITFYVLARTFNALVTPPSESERAKAAAALRDVPFLNTLVNVQALLLLTAVVLIASAPTYRYLGLADAWVFVLRMGGSVVGFAALTSVFGGIAVIARESHKEGGFVRKCHTLCVLILLSITAVARDMRGLFERATYLPAHLR